MKTVKYYEPPSAADMAALKDKLGLTGNQMARLAGVADGNQWRKYTGGVAPRRASLQMLFFIAAQLEFDELQLENVYSRMREIGCELEISDDSK